MDDDLQYYKERVRISEEINSSLQSVGRTNIHELMSELRELSKQISKRKQRRFPNKGQF